MLNGIVKIRICGLKNKNKRKIKLKPHPIAPKPLTEGQGEISDQ